MSKKIQARFDSDNNRIIILSDDVKKDDYIEIDNLSSWDKYIENEITKKFKAKIINDYKQTEEFKQLNNYKDNFNNLNHQYEILKKDSALAISNFKNSDEYQELLGYKKNFEKYQEDFIKTKTLEIEKEINKKINDEINQKNIEITKLKAELSTKIDTFKNSFEYTNIIDQINKLKIQNKDYEHSINDLKKDYENKINKQQEEYKKEIDNIKNFRSSQTIKLLGEEFEKYFENEYENHYNFLDNCEFKKTTETINGTKPDYKFSVYKDVIPNHDKRTKEWEKDNLCGCVIFEMKAEFENSVNKRKIKDHLPKLESDRQKHEADLAILVTTQEQDDSFIIKRYKEYKDIIVIRPEMFVAIVAIFIAIAIKRKEILLQEIEFKNKQEIIDEFNHFKNNLLNKCIEKINKNCEIIKKSALEIEKQAKKIIDSADKIINTHVNTFKNKFEKFNITNKIIKKIKNKN